MANLKPVYASEATAMSTEINSLADAGAASSTSEVDNSSNRYIDAFIDIRLAASGAATGYCAVYILQGSVTGTLATTQTTNMRHVCDVAMNGTTAVLKTVLVRGMPKYWKARLVNNAGASLASSGNTIKYTGVNYENV